MRMTAPYGYQWEPDEYPEPRCPCCGNVCETIFRKDGEVIGCEECITQEDSTDAEECYGGRYG